MKFAPVEKLVEAIRNGEMVILVDDASRENEGDFVMAAEKASAESITYMAKRGSGLICAPMASDYADRLELPLMTENPTDPEECAFTISVDAKVGATTGISAFERAHTSRLLASPSTRPQDLRRPGHLFPLRARPRGVLDREGHTEAAVDLARMAGCSPVGLICEIMQEDGTMARLPELQKLAREENLLLGKIEDLVAYRQQHEDSSTIDKNAFGVCALSAARMPTPNGVFDILVFSNSRDEEIVVLKVGDLDAAARNNQEVLMRMHSACFTGDVLDSLRCDCGGQLKLAMERIADEGTGLIVYLPQEGRGIGLAKKIEAYFLQQQGLDTVEANHELGYPADLRTYEDAAAVLQWYGLRKVKLLTNNPAKVQALREHGLEVTERVPIETGPGPVNHGYLKTKKGKLGHLFEAV